MSDKRVTQEDIEANIVAEYYFTAEDGATDADPCSPIFHREELSRLTFCILILKNGFVVTGESACVDAANFDAEIGRDYARMNAIDKVWPLMGYELRSKLVGARA